MVRGTLLCNAGLALEYDGALLLVDVLNRESRPFYGLPEETARKIQGMEPPYDRLCGLYFTHTHPDHCDLEAVARFQAAWPQIPVFLPEKYPAAGTLTMGPFRLEFMRVPHAPMPQETPAHVVTWIRAGEKTLYVAADAALDCEAHRRFWRTRKADAAFWNAMYLSRPETRALLAEGAERNYIYHMPANRQDDGGIWRKCQANLRRHGGELQTVAILDRYPQDLMF